MVRRGLLYLKEYGVFDHRGAIGKLAVEPRGLYVTLTGTLPDPGTLVRLWLVGRNETALLATAVPEEGRLLCRRTMSRQSLPEGLLGAVAVPLEPVWMEQEQWRYRLTPQEAAIAEPYTEGAPIEQVAYYPQLQPETIDGTTWLVRRMSLREFVQEQMTAACRGE